MKAPAGVQGILQAALRRFGLDGEIAKYNFVLHWKEIVGEEVAKRTKPECVRDGALIIRVCNSVWAQELSFQQETILRRLAPYLEDGQTVSEVLFYVGDVEAK